MSTRGRRAETDIPLDTSSTENEREETTHHALRKSGKEEEGEILDTTQSKRVLRVALMVSISLMRTALPFSKGARTLDSQHTGRQDENKDCEGRMDLYGWATGRAMRLRHKATSVLLIRLSPLLFLFLFLYLSGYILSTSSRKLWGLSAVMSFLRRGRAKRAKRRRRRIARTN